MGFIRELRDFITAFSYPDNFLGFGTAAPSQAGVQVNELSSLQSAAIVGCIRIISGLQASLPLNVMEITKTGRRIATDHPIQYLLNSQPNPETDSYMFKETLQIHLLLAGNAYAEIVYDNGGSIAGIYQRSPFLTFPYRNTVTGELLFKTTDGMPTARERTIPAENMVHIKGLSLDGLIGINPIKSFAREVVGLDLAARNFGARLFANNASPGGYLQTDANLKEDKRKGLEESWIKGHSGVNSHKFAVLDSGLKWNAVSLSPEESQFLETRGYQRNEIATIYGVPPHLLGDREETRANMEEQNLQLLNITLKPWLKRWESALAMKLLPKVGRNAGKYQISFDTSEMERGDYQTMLEAVSVGRQWGIYTANEAREILHINPYDDTQTDVAPADQLWRPVNMVDAAAPPPQEAQPDAKKPDPEKKDDAEPDVKRAITTYSRIFRDAFNRVLSRDKVDAKLFSRAFIPTLFGLADLFYMQADPDFRTGENLPVDVGSFISDYIGAMQKRSVEWNANAADSELDRAVRAIKVAVYREVETRKAKETPDADHS